MNHESPESSQSDLNGGQKGNIKKRTLSATLPPSEFEPTLKRPLFSDPPHTSTSATIQIPSKYKKQAKKRPVFKFGNYPGYYGYRLDESGCDPRIDMLDKAWFCEKRVLDIGCNSGVLTIRLAQKFLVSSIHGIDIDKSLIDRANKNLQSISTPQQTPVAPSLSKQSKFHGGGVMSWIQPSSASKDAALLSINANQESSSNTATSEPAITFQVANYLTSATRPSAYDTILWYGSIPLLIMSHSSSSN